MKSRYYENKFVGRAAEGTEILERIFNVMFYDRRVMMSKGFVLLLTRRWKRLKMGKWGFALERVG